MWSAQTVFGERPGNNEMAENSRGLIVVFLLGQQSDSNIMHLMESPIKT